MNENEFLKLKGKTFECLLSKSDDIYKLIRSAFVISLCHDKCIKDEKLYVCEQFIYECASKINLNPNINIDYKTKFSLIRNKLAFDLAKDLGVKYTPDSRFVDVVLNGKHIGNYICINISFF